MESSDSMKCRGYSLKGRTSFSIYRFDNRDRSFVIAIFLLLIITVCGWALDQTSIHYNPQIIMTGITFMSYISVSYTHLDVYKRQVMDLQASSLNQFNIEKALLAGEKHELCFSREELNKVLEDRESEGMQAREEAESSESSQGTGNAAGKNPAQSGSSQSNGGSSSSGSGSGGSGSSVSYDYTCTIEIRCDTILNNMGQLSPGKEGYVPSGGIILRTTTVGFNKGETVFDVLNRICNCLLYTSPKD